MNRVKELKPQEDLQGAAAAPGVAIGPAVCLRGHGVEVLRVPIRSSGLDREAARFGAAVRSVEAELEATESRIAETFGSDLASIFHAHSVILRDSSFALRIDRMIRNDRVNAEWAVQAVADDLGEKFAQVKSQHLRERGEDLRDVTRYLLRALAGKRSSPGVGEDFDRKVVVVSHELTPDEVLRLGRRGAVGFAIEVGGANSHTAIVARALDVPLVTGIVEITNQVADDDPVIVDGEEGRLTLHPTPETLDEYRRLRRRRRRNEEALSTAARDLPARTVDGAEVELLANVELPDELDDVQRFGAAGIGLYRSEFLYLEKSPELPSEEEHVAVLRELLETLSPQPVVVRTLDLGGGKVASGLVPQDEENPVLGQRGIRLTMAREDVFRVQLRALFRAAPFGSLRIMAPMVTAVEEIRALRVLCDDVCAELEAEGSEHRRDVELGADGGSAGGGDDRPPARGRSRLPLHRHERPDPVHTGGRPNERVRRRPLSATASGRADHDSARGRGGTEAAGSGRPVWRDGGKPRVRSAHAGAWSASALDESPGHSRGQGCRAFARCLRRRGACAQVRRGVDGGGGRGAARGVRGNGRARADAGPCGVVVSAPWSGSTSRLGAAR